jgi:hypothetical protein
MRIDPLNDEILTFAQAARRLPRLRNGRPVSPSTVWRWCSAGLHGVRLETVKVGGVTCTSTAALQRFFAALSDRPAPTHSANQEKHDDLVEHELAARGI